MVERLVKGTIIPLIGLKIQCSFQTQSCRVWTPSLDPQLSDVGGSTHIDCKPQTWDQYICSAPKVYMTPRALGALGITVITLM